MRIRSHVFPFVLAIVVAAWVAGCGDSDNNENISIPVPTHTPANGRTATITPVGQATPTAQATLPDQLPSETPTSEGPLPTATPVAGGCAAGDKIVVVESLDQPYGGANVTLLYPASVAMPGTGAEKSVTDRVVFSNTGGIPAATDGDTNGDQVEDTITAAFTSLSSNPAGTYATITFDCVEGQAPPSAGAFTCTVVSASSSEGRDITSSEHCTLAVSKQ